MSLGREKAMEREVCFDRPAQPGCGRNGEVGVSQDMPLSIRLGRKQTKQTGGDSI